MRVRVKVSEGKGGVERFILFRNPHPHARAQVSSCASFVYPRPGPGPEKSDFADP